MASFDTNSSFLVTEKLLYAVKNIGQIAEFSVIAKIHCLWFVKSSLENSVICAFVF